MTEAKERGRMPLIAFRAPAPTVKAIKKAAREEGCSVSEWIRRASRRTIERNRTAKNHAAHV